jgi:hypothetical protein
MSSTTIIQWSEEDDEGAAHFAQYLFVAISRQRHAMY